MTKFTAIAATLLATTGASVASAQVADPVTGTVDATAETRVDTGPVIDGTTDTVGVTVGNDDVSQSVERGPWGTGQLEVLVEVSPEMIDADLVDRLTPGRHAQHADCQCRC